jgi:nitrogen fixation NifU-like protein
VNDQPAPASLTTLYRDVIRRHAADPTGFRRPIEATHRHEAYNALCGDRVDITLQVGDGHVQAAAFDGEACAICLASASLLCSLVPGESVEGVRRMAADLTAVLSYSVGADASAIGPAKTYPGGNAPPPSRMNPLPPDAVGDALPPSRMNPLLQVGDCALPEELRPLLGVRPYPSRVRCATLPWEAVLRALEKGKKRGRGTLNPA